MNEKYKPLNIAEVELINNGIVGKNNTKEAMTINNRIENLARTLLCYKFDDGELIVDKFYTPNAFDSYALTSYTVNLRNTKYNYFV